MPKKLVNTRPQPLTTILVGLTLPGISKQQTQRHLDELAQLAITRGIKPIARFSQELAHPHAKTWIGSGKVQEIATFVEVHKADSVLFDDELSPGKVKNLHKLLGCKVWDRTLLILEIFSMSAQTAQAKTQVKLAQYQYLLPRLTRMWSHLSRQKGSGGAGMQGTGEKELETDRRMVQEKIHRLKQALVAIEKQSMTQRKQRSSSVNVALVGYTNAGKSTLMQSLTKQDTVIEDKLFATLNTTVRKVVVDEIPFLLSDTVGFIRKLPHTLIASFKSTLAETCSADLLLHVVDFSHVNFEEHINVVKSTLKELGADTIPTILVFNKVDKACGEDILSDRWSYDSGGYHALQSKYTEKYKSPVVMVAAKEKKCMEGLYRVLYRYVSQRYYEIYPQ